MIQENYIIKYIIDGAEEEKHVNAFTPYEAIQQLPPNTEKITAIYRKAFLKYGPMDSEIVKNMNEKLKELYANKF